MPQEWTSAEEAAQFRKDLGLGDWQIMGRTTHQLAASKERRRIIFSTSKSGWDGRHLWLDPEGLTPDDLAEKINGEHPLQHGLILGGTGVHDWFLDHDAIDQALLTVEPVRFGAGLPVFTGQGDTDNPVTIFEGRGFVTAECRELNDTGTYWVKLVRKS